ncbi:type III polyketide synthase [Deinococcus sedimenti]|uniref:Naringenin-chalcone synthase n=1 Tax=Deinococcus sedimenti TaxID=1867090 RepID=A0ABQ2S393_9DEIO|nr:3-oxoacyl-[acyl-carrier-protein] synthase III C-terminal domain-containing protein [Deinococcus sedimenti]GGR93454.1 naringenin-chalcone synthase [Deinococcus sedimenti]
MPVYLHAVAPTVPPIAYPQEVIRDIIRTQPELDRLGQRLTTRAFNASGIDRRHSVVPDFLLGTDDPPGLFYDAGTGRMLTPGTGARNAFYVTHATPLFVNAARSVLASSPFGADDVTHVITVSCTGFFAPGPDYEVVRALELSGRVARFHVGFMGCYAAFPALKMARAFCDADPDAVVLVVCAELCTIHMHSAADPDTVLANSVFADGAAAAIVSARPPASAQGALRLDAFETTLTPPGVGQQDMAWTIGDQGYDMILSTYVPDIIETHISGALAPLLAQDPALAEAAHGGVQHWAIHPGGRSILDKVQSSLALRDEQLLPSREVLRQYGNMSSATVLFILADLLTRAADGERVCAMAFGPGLTVETGLMTRVTG